MNQKIFLRPVVQVLKKARVFGALSARLTKWTGKSPYPVHPKHLISIEEPWYLAGLEQKDTVLDLGCGNGQNSLKAAKHVKKIIGVDIRPAQIALAVKAVEEKNIDNASFFDGDIEEKLPFKNNSFDKAFLLDVLEHLTNRGLVIKEILRVLKPNGKLFLAIPNKDTSWKRIQRSVGVNSFTDPDHKIEYSQEEIVNLCQDAGFSLQSVSSVTYDTPWAPFIDLIGGFSLSFYQKLQEWKKRQVRIHPEETIGFRLVLIKI